MKIINKSTLHLILTYFLLLIVTLTFAQNPVKFSHLTVNEGLSNSAVNCVLQDSQGYIWIATQDGLNRYDGYKVEVFRKDAKSQYGFTAILSGIRFVIPWQVFQ
jgi:ligand-binding sensor domain-containing protein